VAAVVGDRVQRTNMPGDVAGALAYVANWRFLLSEQSYADLFAEPSPLLHFWSLAIEEQFYVVFPLVVAAAWAATRRVRGRHVDRSGRVRSLLGVTFVVLAAGSLALTFFAGLDDQDVYLNTGTRAFEVLVGVVLAIALSTRVADGWLDRLGPTQRGVAGLGLLTALGAVVAWVLVPQDAPALFRGGLAVYALGSAVTVLAAALCRGPVAAALSTRPLVHLGHISYGVYLYHWPIFLWLKQGTELGPWPRFLLGTAITLVLAELSARWIERPVRQGHQLLRTPSPLLAPVAAAAVLVAALLVSSTTPPPTIDIAAATTAIDQAALASPPPTGPTTTVPNVPPTARVAFFGDSTATMAAVGFADWLTATGRGGVVPLRPGVGCSLMGGDVMRLGTNRMDVPSVCDDWPTTWAAHIAEHQPSTVVVQLGAWDVQDRQIGGDPTWRAPGDPIYDEMFTARLLEAVDVLSASGARVVWVKAPVPDSGRGDRRPDPAYDAVAPRMEILNDLIARLPALRPGKVRVVDLAAWLGSFDGTERLRPDGMHFSRETAAEVAEQFLGPAVLGPDWWNRPEPPPAD